jgi:hypothetical protein
MAFVILWYMLLLQMSYEDGIRWLNGDTDTQARLQKAEEVAKARAQLERQAIPSYATRCSVCGSKL